jgi:hypothetical protein
VRWVFSNILRYLSLRPRVVIDSTIRYFVIGKLSKASSRLRDVWVTGSNSLRLSTIVLSSSPTETTFHRLLFFFSLLKSWVSRVLDFPVFSPAFLQPGL